MSLNVTDKGGSSRPLVPAGTHIARCIRLIDLGTQDDTYMGQPKINPKIRIGWELPDERMVFDPAKGEQPFFLDKEYTASLGEKANLRHDLEGWRGRAFTVEELAGFDLKNIVGQGCMVTVVHKKSLDGTKTYDKITGVAALPKDPATKKRMVVPPQENPSVTYDIADGENEVFRSLPEWIQKTIRASHEFNESTRGGPDDREPEFNDEPEEEEIAF